VGNRYEKKRMLGACGVLESNCFDANWFPNLEEFQL